jgi:hypothetical protein
MPGGSATGPKSNLAWRVMESPVPGGNRPGREGPLVSQRAWVSWLQITPYDRDELPSPGDHVTSVIE